MKTHNYYFSFLLSVVFLSCLQLSCTKKIDKNGIQNKGGIATPYVNATTATTSYSCGSTLSGTYLGSGYYIYPDYTIDLTSSPQGTLIQISCDAVEVPNRFSVYDGTNLLVTTGWIGTANYSGPWGTSLNQPATQTLSFIKGTSNIYTLRVETSPQNMTDAWNVTIGCSVVVNPTPTCACGSLFSGNYSGSGYYIYPNTTLNLFCATVGSTVQVSCDAVEVPNRFTVYDVNNNLLVTTGWIGTADYSGPWGPSINNPATKTITFTRSASSTYYYLKVETSPQNMTDAWNATIGCQ